MAEIIEGWYVLYVKYQHEKKICEYLKDYDINYFLPSTTVVRQWKDRKRKIQRPLFPSYVFTYLDSKKKFYNALSIQGAFKFIRFGDEYAQINQNEINQIKQLLNFQELSDINIVNRTGIRVGKKMKIKHGPLAGLICEVTKAKNNSRIIVSVESLKQNIVASLPINYLTHIA